jgi:hypothetical protein
MPPPPFRCAAQADIAAALETLAPRGAPFMAHAELVTPVQAQVREAGLDSPRNRAQPMPRHALPAGNRARKHYSSPALLTGGRG